MTDHLAIPQVASNQDQKETTINDATLRLSGALADVLSCDLSAGDYVLTLDNSQKYFAFATTGNTVSRNFTVPANARAIFMVQNGGTYDLSVVRGTTTLDVPPGASCFFQTDGTSNGIVKINPSQFKDVIIPVGGSPSANLLYAFPFNEAVTLPAGLVGSNFYIDVDPSSTFTITLYKNGSSIGTVQFSTLGAPTVTFASSVSFAVGDKFRVAFPGSVDATAAGVGLSFRFTVN